MQSLISGRSGYGNDPLLDILRQELGSMFDQFPGLQGGSQGRLAQYMQQRIVPVELVETQNDYRIIAEVAGLREQEIEVLTTGDNTITIQGTKTNQYGSQYGNQNQGQQNQQTQGQQSQGQQGQQGQGQERGQVLISERVTGEFRRSITLPSHIDRERVTATCNNGLLTVTVPKSSDTQRQQRRVEVRQNTQAQQNR